MPRILTSADKIRERLRTFDRAYLDSMHKQMRYLMGDGSWAGAADTDAEVGDDGYPRYMDKAKTGRRVGQSRRILNAALANLSTYVSSEPDPQFPQLKSKIERGMRRELFLARYRGSGRADGEWGTQLRRAFLDADNLGLGWCKFGAKRDPLTGETYTHCTYVPCTNVIYDPLEAEPERSSWVATIAYIPEEEAIARWGEERVKPAVRQSYKGSREGVSANMVRVTEYWDLGLGSGWDDSQPTYAVFLGAWNSKPVVRTKNAYGVLPVAWMMYVAPPGERRPIGKVDLQLATQEAINDCERAMRRAVKKLGIDFIDFKQVNKSDMAAIAAGRDLPFVRLELPNDEGRPVVQRVPAADVSQTLLQYLQVMERQYNSDSQSSELSRGNGLQTKRTATELELISTGLQSQQTYTREALIAFYRRVVETFCAVAKVDDKSPVSIDVDGVDLIINDPDDPRLAAARILEEPSSVLISPQSLEGSDSDRETNVELQKLAQVRPFLGTLVRPDTYLKRLLRAIGEDDPTEWLIGDQGAGGAPAMPGQPPVPGVPGAAAPMPMGPPPMATATAFPRGAPGAGMPAPTPA